MSINQSENDLEGRLITQIKDMQRQIFDLRSKQRVSADTISTSASNTYTFGPLTVAAASYGYFNITVTPNVPTLTIWNHEVTVFVDSNGLSGFQFPGGASLSSGQAKMRQSVWLDWFNSNDVIGARNVKIVIENTDASSHNYYILFNSVSPTLPIN